MNLNPDQVKQIIQGAPPGTPPEQIINSLMSRGHTIQGVNDGAQSANPQEGAQLHDTGSFGGNLANSAGNFLGGIGHAIAHPIDTAKGVFNMGLGAAEKLVPGQQGAETDFNHVVDFYKQRYGSVDNFLKTLHQDPVGAAADASLLFSGMAGVLGKVGEVGDIGKFTQAANAAKGADFIAGAEGVAKTGDAVNSVQNFASKAAGMANKASEFTNPLNAIIKPVGAVKNAVGSLAESQASKLANPDLGASKSLTNKFNPQQVEDIQATAKNIPGTTIAEKSANAAKITKALDEARDATLADSKLPVPRSLLVSELEKIKKMPEFTTDTANYHKIVSAVDKTIENIRNNFGEVIPVQTVNEFKIKAGYDAFPEFGSKVSNELSNAVRGIYQTTVENMLQGAGENGWSIPVKVPEELRKYVGGKETMPIGEFNAEFQKNVRAAQALKRGAEAPPTAFQKGVHKLASEGIGGLAGHALGGPGGALAGIFLGPQVEKLLMGTQGKSTLIKGLNTAASVSKKIKLPAGVKIGATAASRANSAKQ